ncbi:MAG: beta/gamma crystallin-related protein [Burkholderiaceae bacterium]|nr:beta/gamma crystallin-related protein [Burkholderiaceae bacterium]
MNILSKTAWMTLLWTLAVPVSAQVTFFQEQGFAGRSFTTESRIGNLERFGFNDRASSAIVENQRWEVCEHARFGGRCVVLRPGQYPSLAAMGMNDRISSARAIARDARVDERRYAPAPPAAQITFYEDRRFGGRSYTTLTRVEDLRRKGFNDRVSSLVVTGPDDWEACEDVRFNGRCIILRPGEYPNLRGTALNDRISSVRRVARKAPEPSPETAQIALFGQEGFAGRAFTTDRSLENLRSEGFNDRASSAVVVGERYWEVCDDAHFNGRCMVLRPGQYPSLSAMGMNNRISSVREIRRDAHLDEARYAPAPIAAPNYRQRKDERLFEADVTSVRAVVGTPEKRCWIEREQAPQSEVNAPGAVLGALLGGVLGHQVGGGSGKDIATAGGAIAGAVIGSKIGGTNGTSSGAAQDVQRCEDVPSQAHTAYWDVTYSFRGEEHRIQMASPPGRTITVNAQGEPRT